MKKSAKVGIGIGIGLVAVVGGAYVASYFVAGNQLPAKASVAGVAIGGMSPEQARQTLESELSDSVAKPVSLVDGSHSATLDPAEAGLGVDYDATVREAGGGFSWNPLEIVTTFTGGHEIDLVRTVDEDKLSAAVAATADEFEVKGTDASISFKEGKVVTTGAVDATVLDVDAAVDATSQAWEAGRNTVQAPVTATAPAVTDAMVAEAVDSFADPLVSGPVTLTLGDDSMEIAPGSLAAVASFEVKDGKLVGSLDGAKLFKDTREAQRSLKLTSAKDASFKFSGGEVVVVKAKTGQSLDQDSFMEAVEKTATATGDARTAEVTATKEEPDYTTKEAQADVKDFEVIGEFTTYYPHADYRNTNLGRAASSVNGTVLMPGDIFSLNDTLGERTPANGYVDGYVINGGRLVKESGGGISQSATTLFNAAFFAGYKDIEHKPHSLYFDRYPAGREATVYYGSLDMRFQNDTNYPSIIQGYINKSSGSSRGSITFRIWSKRTWDKVESSELKKSNFYSGTKRTVTAANCSPQAAIQGFTVNYSRLFYMDGKVVRREPFTWTYSAGDQIVCE